MLGSEAGRKLEEIELLGQCMNEQLVITEEAGVVPVLPGEGEHMQSLGWNGRRL